MLCSSCSSPLKPVVALDIDGTMGHYHAHFLHFAATYFGYATWEEYDGRLPFRDWFTQEFECDLRTFRDVKLAYRQGAQKRSMPVTDWARPLTAKLREMGAEIWVTTTRPYMRLDNVDPDTRFWLDRHDIKHDFLIYGDHKYADLALQVDRERVCFVLDDLFEQLVEARRFFNGIDCFLYATNWNSHHWKTAMTGPTVNASAVIPTAIERVEAWINAH